MDHNLLFSTKSQEEIRSRISLHQALLVDDFDFENCLTDNTSAAPMGKSFSASDDPMVIRRELPNRSPPSPWSTSPLIRSPSPPLFHTCIASLHRLNGCIHSIGLSKTLVFTSSDSDRIRVWSSNDQCTDLGYFKVKSGEIRSILCHDNMIFAAHKDYKIRIWSFSSNAHHFKKVMTLPKKKSFFPFISKNTQQSSSTHKDKISCMAFNHVEGLLYTGSWDKTVRVWNLRDRICQEMIFAHEEKINAILIGHEGEGSIFTCSSDGSIKIWNKSYGDRFHTLVMALKFQSCSMIAMALSESNINQTKSKTSILYAGSSDGLVNFWIKEKDSARYNHGGFFQGHSFAVLCLAAIDNLLFSGSEDTMIRVWRREERGGGGGLGFTHACLTVIQGHRGPVKCIAACSDKSITSVKGFLVYSGALDKSFKVWRVRVAADDIGNKALEIGDDQGRSVSVKCRSDELLRSTSMKCGGCSEACDPVLSPAWVEKRLSASMNY